MASVDPKVLLLKEEVTPGTDSVPTGAANAILIQDEVTVPKLNIKYAERNNAKGFYGRDQSLVVGKSLNIGFSVELAGSGAAGTAPKYGPVLKCSGMGELLVAAAVTGTATAGAASTITLAAGASAVDDFYRYNTIRTTGGTGSGQSRVIGSYVGATKVATVTQPWATAPDATTTYSIDAQANYYPITTGQKTATIYFYYLGMLHKLLYARGTPSFKFPAGELPSVMFDFVGLYGGIVDAAIVAATLSGFQEPLGVNNANTGSFVLHNTGTLKLYSLMAELGNNNVYRNIVGAEDTLHNDREPKGSIEIEAPLVATFDYATKVNAASLGVISLTHGTANGNKVKFDAALVQLTNPSYGEKDKEGTLNLELAFKPGALGNDDFIISAL